METYSDSRRSRDSPPAYTFTCKYASSSHVGFNPMAISVRLNEVHLPQMAPPTMKKGRSRGDRNKKQKTRATENWTRVNSAPSREGFKRAALAGRRTTLWPNVVGSTGATTSYLPPEEYIVEEPEEEEIAREQEEEEDWNAIA